MTLSLVAMVRDHPAAPLRPVRMPRLVYDVMHMERSLRIQEGIRKNGEDEYLDTYINKMAYPVAYGKSACCVRGGSTGRD
jgi:hypothetical protein